MSGVAEACKLGLQCIHLESTLVWKLHLGLDPCDVWHKVWHRTTCNSVWKAHSEAAFYDVWKVHFEAAGSIERICFKV